MSRFTRYAVTTQSLSLAAMEEASRRGLREADLEELFLALALSDQPAGQALRHLGVTISAARAAVEGRQKEQIASLGVIVDIPEAGNIVFHETGGYEWSRRAKALIGRAGEKGRTADAAAVLRELLDEPSGLVTELLHRLGTTPASVLEELERIESTRPVATRRKASSQGEATGSTGAFVPGDIGDVWAFLADPARIPEWEPAIGSVESAGGTAMQGMTWTAYARLGRADGKPIKVNEKYRRRTIELLKAEHLTRIDWRFSYPDAPTSSPIIIGVSLEPTTGGTQLTIAMTWFKRPGLPSVLWAPLRPLQRFLLWIKLFQISSSISRTFRQT